MPSFPNCLQCGKSNKGECTCKGLGPVVTGYTDRALGEIDQLKADLRSMEDYALGLKRSEAELMDEVATLRAIIEKLEA